MKKKAVVEVQFNWVFILIIGAIILIFFTTVALKYKKNEEAKISFNVLSDLDAMIAGLGQLSGATNKIEIPDQEITVECFPETCTDKSGCTSDLKIAGSDAVMETPIAPIFSPAKIKGNYLLSWTLDWNMPFKVVNFLYLTREDIRYVIVYDDDKKDAAEKLYDKMMDFNKSINLEFKPKSDFDKEEKENSFYLNRIVYFGEQGDLSIAALPDNYDVVYVDESTEKVTFSKDNEQLDYYELPMLIGAIFSEDADMYECNKQKADFRLKHVASVYKQRAKKLLLDLPSCYYAPEDFGEDNNPPNVNNLKQQNENALIRSCPRIY